MKFGGRTIAPRGATQLFRACYNDAMGERDEQVMGWGAIIGIGVAVGVVLGVTYGLLRSAFDLTGGTSAVGAGIGVTVGLLVGRRNRALARRASRG